MRDRQVGVLEGLKLIVMMVIKGHSSDLEDVQYDGVVHLQMIRIIEIASGHEAYGIEEHN